MRLTDITIRNSKPREKSYKLSDGGGLVLIINPNGSRWWRLRYCYGGREKMLSLGIYPGVSLKDARDKRDADHKVIASGRDPSYERRTERDEREITFELVAREWLALQRKSLAIVTYRKALWILESLLFPSLGNRPITHISAPELLVVLRRIEEKGHHETARRAKQRCSQIFRYAIATDRAQRDIALNLRGAMAPVVARSHAAITDPTKIGALLRAMRGYGGQFIVASALQLAPLVFVRPNELRAAEWVELDLENAVWRIGAHRMKMRQPHIVPLSRQALTIFRDVHDETGGEKLVFPSLRTSDRPISENTLNAALRRLGYSNAEMTSHGFRAMASTRLNELGWAPDLIELQLAHTDKNKVRAIYNRAERLDDRREMMQAWADYLDTLRLNQSHTVRHLRGVTSTPKPVTPQSVLDTDMPVDNADGAKLQTVRLKFL